MPVPPEESPFSDGVVCGGGPAGLLSAIMLAQKFPKKKIQLFEKSAAPPSPDAVWDGVAPFYLILLQHRAKNALKKVGVWEDVKGKCVATNSKRVFTFKPQGKEEGGVAKESSIVRTFPTVHVIAQEKLVAVLDQHIRANYRDQIELHYGCKVESVDFGHDGNKPRIRVVKGGASENDGFSVETSFLVGADGAHSKVATCMEEHDENRSLQRKNFLQRLWGPKPFEIKQFVDNNQRVYKTFAVKLPSDWAPDFMYAASTPGRELFVESAPMDLQGSQCVTVTFPKDSTLAKANADPMEMRTALDQFLPRFSAFMDDETVATLAKKPTSKLPSYAYAGPRLHQGDHTVILGDCAHKLKPQFGLGCNAALQDVMYLNDALDESPRDMGRAVRLYSRKSAGEAKAVVELVYPTDRPGLGKFRFILPLIVDTIFHELAPAVFAPNLILMLFQEGITFQGIQRRKVWDRVGQMLLLSTIVAAGVIASGRFMSGAFQGGLQTSLYRTLWLLPSDGAK